MYKKVSSRKELARQHSCHKIFGHGRGRGRPMVKIFLSPCLITMQNLLTVFRTVCVRACRRSQKIGDAWARPLGWRAWLKERRPSDTSVTPPNVIVYDCNYRDPPENFRPSRPAFQGHSMSLEVETITRIDRPTIVPFPR